jgi:hypothetical protein
VIRSVRHRRPTNRQPLARRRVLLLTWGLATLAGLLVAWATKLGPILLIFTDGHGVHLGDVVGFVVFYVAAAAAMSWDTRRRVAMTRPRAQLRNAADFPAPHDVRSRPPPLDPRAGAEVPLFADYPGNDVRPPVLRPQPGLQHGRPRRTGGLGPPHTGPRPEPRPDW